MSKEKENGRITELHTEILAYRQAIRNAQDALDDAERELDELLSLYAAEEPTGENDPSIFKAED